MIEKDLKIDYLNEYQQAAMRTNPEKDLEKNLGYRDWETALTIVTGKQIGRAHV